MISLCNSALADCDFSTGITKQSDGKFLYLKECHIAVGQMKIDLDAANVQLEEYRKAIDLKDLALVKTNERSNLWMDTTFKLQDRMNTVDSLKSKNEIIYFGVGILFTGLAVWGAGQLAHH